jgi:hypothetical protein
MILTTRNVRNLALVAMLAVVPLIQQVPVFAGEFCGPEWCSSLCATGGGGGGYLGYQDCDPGSCAGSGCAISGENCQETCIWCPGEEIWLCS